MKRITATTALVFWALTATGTTVATAAPPWKAPTATLITTTATLTATGTYFVTATLSWKKVARADVYEVCVYNVTSRGVAA